MQPIAASIRVASATCSGSLECDAQASAMASAPRPNRSAAPSATMGSAWNGLAAERQYVTSSGSPAEATRRAVRVHHGHRHGVRRFDEIAAGGFDAEGRGWHGGQR